MIFTLLLNLILLVTLGVRQSPALVYSDAQLISLKAAAEEVPLASDASSRSAVLAADDRFLFFSHQADEVQPIASITKLMTALVFLDHNPGWDKIYQIKAEDKIEGGRLNLFLGDRVKVRDIFYTSLVASDNGATLALVHSTGLSETEFVKLMNEKATSLNLVNTKFNDATGLSKENVSTAHEVALLARTAFNVLEIREATVNREYSFITEDGREKKIESTDDLLYVNKPGRAQILGGKTGYTQEAGYCYVGYMRGQNERAVISVVLGANTRDARFRVSSDLAQWVLDNFEWRDF